MEIYFLSQKRPTHSSFGECPVWRNHVGNGLALKSLGNQAKFSDENARENG